MKCFAVGTEKKKKKLSQLSACSLQSNKTRAILGTAVFYKSRLGRLGVLMIVLLCVPIWVLGLIANIILWLNINERALKKTT